MRRLLVLTMAAAWLLGASALPAQAADGDVFDEWSISTATIHPVNGSNPGLLPVTWDAPYSPDGPPSVSVGIVNTTGRTVLYRDFGQFYGGRWSWNGYDDDLHVVPPGQYTLTLTGAAPGTTNPDGTPTPGPSEVHSATVTVSDSGVCYGVSRCHVQPSADIDGDGASDTIGTVSRRSGADRAVIVRVKTAPQTFARARFPAPYWHGALWQGAARLDGRRGREIVVGQTSGAHAEFFRAVTWRAGRLVTLDAPGTGTYWYVDGAVSVSAGWQRRVGDPVGTIWKRTAVRVGDPVNSRFRGTQTKFRWTTAGWTKVVTRRTYPLPDRTAHGWGGFYVRGLARW